MAIKFKVNEEETKLQQQENIKAEQEGRKAKKIKLHKAKKQPIQRWSNFLLVMSIIALVYAVAYSFSGLLTLLPTLILWFAWFILVLVVSVVTVGGVWISDGWNNFNNSFMSFNTSVGNASVAVTDFMYKIFPYLASFFALCLVAFLIVSVVGLKKQQDKQGSYKGKLIASIVLLVLFVVAIIWDIVVFVGM